MRKWRYKMHHLNHKWKKSSDKAYLEILSVIPCGALFPGSGTTETFWLLFHVDQFCSCRFVSSSTPTKALFLGQPQWTLMIGNVFRQMSAWFYSLIHHFLKQCFGIQSDSCTNPSCHPWAFCQSLLLPLTWWARNGITFLVGTELKSLSCSHLLQLLFNLPIPAVPSPPSPGWARIGWAVTHRGHLLGTDLGDLCCPPDMSLMGAGWVGHSCPCVTSPKGGPRAGGKVKVEGRRWWGVLRVTRMGIQPLCHEQHRSWVCVSSSQLLTSPPSSHRI